jgi:hypothetical protein
VNAKEFVVRIIKPSSQPALPKANPSPKLNSRKKRTFLSRASNILTGSAVGFAAGLMIYLMLRTLGANFGGLESSVIIGLPSVLGILTSFVIF